MTPLARFYFDVFDMRRCWQRDPRYSKYSPAQMAAQYLRRRARALWQAGYFGRAMRYEFAATCIMAQDVTF